MEENEIKELIAKKITESKLEVSEKRLHFVMWLGGAIIAVFGVIIPLWQSNHASERVDAALDRMKLENRQALQDFRDDSRADRESLDKATLSIREEVSKQMDSQTSQISNTGVRVDNAIQDMHKQFKELAGAQSRKPILECFTNGASLEGAVLRWSLTNQNKFRINIKNTGDAPANNVMIRIYSNIPGNYYLNGWSQIAVPDEPTYTQAFDSDYRAFSLDPKESQILDLDIGGDLKSGNYPALIKIFYGQPEPMKYSFTINISDK